MYVPIHCLEIGPVWSAKDTARVSCFVREFLLTKHFSANTMNNVNARKTIVLKNTVSITRVLSSNGEKQIYMNLFRLGTFVIERW